MIKSHQSPQSQKGELITAKGDASSLSREIIRRFEEEIIHGKHRPGERLDERQLAEYYGVSRTPVREALQRLAAVGLVETRGRQGLQVSQLTVADLLDAFSVAAELEALAAAQAARRISPGQRSRLEAAHQACETAARAADAERFYDANLEFHETVATASQNRILKEELRRITLKISYYRRAVTYQQGQMNLSTPQHAAVMEAILSGDVIRASHEMRSHVTLLGEGLSDFLHFIRLSGEQTILAASA